LIVFKQFIAENNSAAVGQALSIEEISTVHHLFVRPHLIFCCWIGQSVPGRKVGSTGWKQHAYDSLIGMLVIEAS